MSRRHTNREIEEAKMLARRLEAARGVRTTTSVSFAAKMFGLAFWMLVKHSIRRRWNALLTFLGSAKCPHCYGDFLARMGERCRLCDNRGRIGQAQQEAVRYGKALAGARIEHRVSRAFASQKFSLEWNGEHLNWADLENGYVLLADWPAQARELAETYMREAARPCNQEHQNV
jgi:hypothetical protein